MSRIRTGSRTGHVDQIGIYKDQIPGLSQVFPVIKEKDAFPFHDIEDFILGVKMLHPHIKFS